MDLTQKQNDITLTSTAKEFQKDLKGRMIGAAISTGTVDFVPTAHPGSGYHLPAGHYFWARVQATRNGRGYGAHQSPSYFKTEIEVGNYVARRIADMEKRAEKIAAGKKI